MKSKTAKNIIKDIVIVAVGVAAIWIGLQVVFGTQNPFYVVSSGSMIPVLEVYDVLVVDGKVPFNQIDTGDIIVFNRPNGHDRVIVHRVVAILDEDPKTIRTKGDANPVSIPGTDYPITDKEYIGKVAYVIPQVGYVTRILAPPINYIIIAVIIGIMIVKQYAGKPKQPKFGDLEKDEETDFEKTADDEYAEARSFDTRQNEPSKEQRHDGTNLDSAKDSADRKPDEDKK
jgi:signal peptidase